MGNGHIHDNLSKRQLEKRNASVVEDYVGGMRFRELMKKYQIGNEFIAELLRSSGVSARKGGARKWINKRVRPNGATELTCSKCETGKPINEFPPTGLVCRDCVDKRLAIWRNENRAEMNSYMREWVRTKKKKDPRFRAICAMKCRLVRILGVSGKKKSKASVTHFLGISRNGFAEHIESLMLPGMTWENRSIGVWHIDHIIPCSAFDHSDPRQVRDCWHYTNLQPLWGPDNLRKYNKITIDYMIGPKIPHCVAIEKSLA
jgi:hypothetical protein